VVRSKEGEEDYKEEKKKRFKNQEIRIQKKLNKTR